MNIEFRKKYEIIKSVIDNYGNMTFTAEEIFTLSVNISRKYDIEIILNDVLCVIADLYDNFELDKILLSNGTICFRNNIFSRELQDAISRR